MLSGTENAVAEIETSMGLLWVFSHFLGHSLSSSHVHKAGLCAGEIKSGHPPGSSLHNEQFKFSISLLNGSGRVLQRGKVNNT